MFDVAAPADAPPYATLVLRAEQLSTEELEAVEADLHRAGRSELGVADDAKQKPVLIISNEAHDIDRQVGPEEKRTGCCSSPATGCGMS